MPKRHRRNGVLYNRAQELRRCPTPAEAEAWESLRLHRCLGIKFRRQHVIHGYIVDFYCSGLQLVIELDGPIHDQPDRRAYDQERQRLLEGLGLRVVRLRNEEVSTTRLETIVRAAIAAPPPAPSPRCGEGNGGGARRATAAS